MIHDPNYINEIKKIIQECEKEYDNREDKGLDWEMTKLKIRSFSVPFCVKKKRKRLEFKDSLEKQLETLQVEIDYTNENVNHERNYSITKELEEFERLKISSKIFRSKVKWTEKGENNSKYFLNLEKRNYINKLITTLKIDRKIIKEPNKMSQAQTDFCKDLYSERPNERDLTYQASLNKFLDNNDIKKITTEQNEFCEKTINETNFEKH